MKIHKAIIPAAGLGTRFLPYTKSIAKEMIPILDKPSIQYIIEEGIASGITQFGIIANNDKPEIKNYFSHNAKLESILHKNNKLHLLDSVNSIIDTTNITFIPQEQPFGLGHAILMAKEFVGDNYFSVFLPDEIMIGNIPAMAQLVPLYKKYNASVIAVMPVTPDKISSYGIVAIKKELESTIFEINDLIEKPNIDEAPSKYAIIGRYILSPSIFFALENTKPGKNNELQLTDGIKTMMNNGERVIACIINTDRYDVGNPQGWLQANKAMENYFQYYVKQ